MGLEDPDWDEYAALFDLRRSDFRACPACNAVHRISAHLPGWDLDIDIRLDHLEPPERRR